MPDCPLLIQQNVFRGGKICKDGQIQICQERRKTVPPGAKRRLWWGDWVRGMPAGSQEPWKAALAGTQKAASEFELHVTGSHPRSFLVWLAKNCFPGYKSKIYFVNLED